jgi:dTDP-4-amino-4,6-dideoxygalactose transaminase
MLINDLSARIHVYESKLQTAVKDVIESGWLVLGPKVKQFEQAFADYLGIKRCISLANGTDAIELALRSLGVTQGDRVATVANAGMYTTTALLAIGAEPFFMDVDIDSRNVTLDEVNRAIEAGVKAVVATHLYGLAIPEIREIAALCRNRNIPLLEDCAQAHGSRIAGQCVGTFGDAASFSFYPTKNLGALGDGGAVVSNHQETAERVLRLRQYGWTSKYRVEVTGARNSRLDEIQAAMLLIFLPDLDAANERRRSIARHYSQSISHPDVQVPAISGEEYVAHLYVIRVSHGRDALRSYLQSCTISTDIHYPIPDHRQPIFGHHYVDMNLLNTEQLSNEVVTLPCYPEMSDEQVKQVIEGVNSWRA